VPSTLTSLAIALGLFVLALGLISVGTDQGVDALWAAGLGLLVLGGLIGPALRFAGSGEEDS